MKGQIPPEMEAVFTSFQDRPHRGDNDAVRERHDKSRRSNSKSRSVQDSDFKLTAFENIRISTAPNYLVKDVIPKGGLVVIWGPPKCGKSFVCFDLAMHIALGREYRCHRVQQGTAVYLALEGGAGFAGRVEAWRRHHLEGYRDPVPFYLLDVPVDIVADHVALIEAIRVQVATVPAAVVIDTLNRGLVGDENKSDDMAKFIRAADAIRCAFGCTVIVIHHCGTAGSRPRGHTSLTGADDAQIAVARDDEGSITVTVEHMKDSEASPPMGCRLERVQLGSDDEGDPIMSCVVVPSASTGKSAVKLTGAAKVALEILQELIADSGVPAPASNHIPENVRVCFTDAWRETFCKRRLGDKPDTTRKAFVRAVERLQEAHLIGIWGDMAWLAGHTGHDRTSDKMSASDRHGHTPDGQDTPL